MHYNFLFTGEKIRLDVYRIYRERFVSFYGGHNVVLLKGLFTIPQLFIDNEEFRRKIEDKTSDK